MARKDFRTAVAYLRTSSASNTGADKDSGKRQRATIDAFARSAGFAILDTYYDEAVSGADPVTSRPGFAAMMERIASDGVRVIIVETANRFARDLIVQETGFAMLKEQGVELIAADRPDAFLDDTPTASQMGVHADTSRDKRCPDETWLVLEAERRMGVLRH